MDAGAHHQRPALGHHALVATNRFLVERGNL